MRYRTSATATLVSLLTLSSIGWAGPQGQQTRKSTEPPIANQGKLCGELFSAIGHMDAKGVDALLAQGADPNSRNGLGFAPLYLAAASHQSNVVDALLKAGAKPDAESTYGTPLTFACFTGNVPDAMRFLALGANPDFVRTDGMTPLFMATNVGCTPIVQALIEKKVKINNQDDGGCTALALAARKGFTETGKVLIAAGAKVDLADVEGETPLMQAAKNGSAEFVTLLLQNGAEVNAKDNAKMTALMLAAKYTDNADVVKALVAGKADVDVKDSQGRTAAQIAAARGHEKVAAALTGEAAKPATPSRTALEAVNLSLNQIAVATKAFAEGATCVSCHQEGLGRMATGEAMASGLKFDPEAQKIENQRINGMINALQPLHEAALHSPEAAKQLPLVEINEVTTMYGWILGGTIAQKDAPTPALRAMAMCLARQQAPDGCWTFALPRVPMQSSFFSFTAYAVQAMKAYGSPEDAAEVAKRTADARNWLLAAKPQDSEDRASRLLGLKWADARQEELAAAAADIVKDQQPDGGWSQVPGIASDAYATGQALYALRVAGGMAASDPVYQRGARYLLLNQDEDGSWFVNKRAMPANNYFDSSFPHGESQYSSFNATCYAVLALLPLAK